VARGNAQSPRLIVVVLEERRGGGDNRHLPILEAEDPKNIREQFKRRLEGLLFECAYSRRHI